MNTETPQSDAEYRRIWNEEAAREAAESGQAGTEADVTALSAAHLTPAAATATGHTAPTESMQQERFASLPQEVRDYLSGLEDKVARLDGRVRSNEGSIGGLKSAMQRQREAAQAVREGGGDAPSDSQIRAAQRGGQRAFDKLREQYPEFAEQLGAVLKEELEPLHASRQAVQQQAEQGPTPEEVAAVRREAYIEGKGFAGWAELIRQPEFVGWFKRQPREVQMLGHSPDWDDSVRLLQLHREQASGRGTGGGRRGARDLSGFSGVSELHRRSSQAYRGTRSIDQMTPQEFWQHLNEVDAQTNQRG